MNDNNSCVMADLQFIKEVLNELSVDAENFDFGPSYSLAKDRHRLAKIKINRLIREEKLND